MSIRTSLSELTPEQKKQIPKDLTIFGKETPYGKPPVISAFTVDDSSVTLPFYYGTQLLRRFSGKVYPKREISFTGVLREYQEMAITEAVERLNKVRCIFLNLATGKGKTPTSFALASRIGLKTVVLIHREEIFKSWAEKIQVMSPGTTYARLASKGPVEDVDVLFANPLTVLRRKPSDFIDVGLLIVDEAHKFCSEKHSKSMLFFEPMYCIGLSATIERSDGLDRILDLHFGSFFINVPLWVPHDYYKYSTKIKPTFELNQMGKINWNSLLEGLANHEERNLTIRKMCRAFPDRRILILCKRSDHTISLAEKLQDEKESVDYLTGRKKTFSKDTRILVTTYSKGGIGFDFDVLDMLIVAGDVEEGFDQYFGRCVRREDTIPIVIDLVDDHSSLRSHYQTRKKYAESVGGTVKKFDESLVK